MKPATEIPRATLLPDQLALLREQELRAELGNVLENMTDGFVALDRDWRIIYVNAAAERNNGRSRQSLLGKTHWEAFPAVLGTNFERGLRRAMADQVPVKGEDFYEPEGRWFEYDIHPFLDGGLAFYGRDVTERREALERERRLQSERDESLARLQLQFDRMPIACILFDQERRIIEWNPAAETIFGYTRDEVVGKDGFLVLLPPVGRAQAKAIVDRLLSGDMAAHSINENVTKDGRTITCEWHNTPLQNAEGQVMALLAMAQDITERKRAEEAYRSLISQVKDFAIFATDERGLISSWNEGCQHVLGYLEPEFIGLDVAQLYSADDRDAGIPAAELETAVTVGTVTHARWLVAKGGRRFFAMGASACRCDAAGALIGFSTVLRDLTQMKLSQDQLAEHGESLQRLITERTDQLEKTMERLRVSEHLASLGTLAAGLGHDMGNLILPLEARLEQLFDAHLSTDLQEHLVGIQKCTQYLKRLSTGLRMLAIDPGSRPTERTELNAWWQNIGLMLEDILPQGVQLEQHLPDSPCWVAIGRVGLTQAVFNLVQNAADAMRERGSGRVHISAQENAVAGLVILRVRDDGPGMSDDIIHHCMEPYFSTKERGEWTGMGLAFVHGLVTRAGGQVELDSVIGRGTTVSLVLPRAVVQPAQPLPDHAGAV